MAETIENNVRKVINEEAQTNPKYYEKMSKLLAELIAQRNQGIIDYQTYLAKIKDLAEQVATPAAGSAYPNSLDTKAKQALYDNLAQDEALALKLDEAIRRNKLDGWRDNSLKQRKLRIVVNEYVEDPQQVMELMEIIKAQNEY